MRLHKLQLIWLFAISISFSYNDIIAQCDRERDSLILIDLYGVNPEFQSRVNWVGNGLPMDQWDYVTINTNGCVTSLDLYGTRLTTLPESFGNLNNLVVLFLEVNDLKELPQSIGNLSSLETLNVGWNEIEYLPEELINLTNLRSLGISGNNYPEIPSWIGDMIWLTNLGMQDRKLTEIPVWVKNLRNLDVLVLDFNSIASLPEWLFDLNRLSTLRLYSNKIREISNAIGQLHNLNILDLGNNQLEYLPESISDLPLLRFLTIGGNNLSGIPEWISNLDLIGFGASSCNLTEIPDELANMSRLRNLYLNDNRIKNIPEFVTNFSLINFRINGNELSDLPSSIGNLSTLNWFDISNNFLSFSHVEQVSNTLPGISRFYFHPQNPIYIDTILYFKKGSVGRISLGIDENISDNEYRWTKDRVIYTLDSVNNLNRNTLIIPDVGLEDVGNYMATVTNSRYPLLTLESYPVGIRVCDRASDSLELVQLYNSTNGTGWFNNNGWLTPGVPINNWHGITLDAFGCVNKIDLGDNGLTGSLPGLELNTLDTLILSQNSLLGDIPNDLIIPYVKYVDLASNQFAGKLPMVITEWMQLSNLNVSDNFLRESIPPEIGDLCELEELQLDGNGFEGNIPAELTRLFNLKMGQVNFADNQITSMEQTWVYFCPFGVDIMANNPGGFERFVEICGDTCIGMEFTNLSDFPWLVDTLQLIDCSGNGCYSNRFRADAGFVDVRGVTVAYTRTQCYTREKVYNETINFYDCGGNLLDTYNCQSDEFCPGIAVLSPEDFAALQFDSRWSCLCNGVTCIARDTVVVDAGEVDTLFSGAFVLASDNCTPGLYSISSLNNELPGEPPYVTEDNIGFSYTLINENLISGAQCTTTIEVVRGSTGTSDQAPDFTEIVCYPNPVSDFLYCADIDLEMAGQIQVLNLQGKVMPARVSNTQGQVELDVTELPAGMYILVVRDQDKQLVNRFTVFR